MMRNKIMSWIPITILSLWVVLFVETTLLSTLPIWWRGIALLLYGYLIRNTWRVVLTTQNKFVWDILWRVWAKHSLIKYLETFNFGIFNYKLLIEIELGSFKKDVYDMGGWFISLYFIINYQEYLKLLKEKKIEQAKNFTLDRSRPYFVEDKKYLYEGDEETNLRINGVFLELDGYPTRYQFDWMNAKLEEDGKAIATLNEVNYEWITINFI